MGWAKVAVIGAFNAGLSNVGGTHPARRSLFLEFCLVGRRMLALLGPGYIDQRRDRCDVMHRRRQCAAVLMAPSCRASCWCFLRFAHENVSPVSKRPALLRMSDAERSLSLVHFCFSLRSPKGVNVNIDAVVVFYCYYHFLHRYWELGWGKLCQPGPK